MKMIAAEPERWVRIDAARAQDVIAADLVEAALLRLRARSK
jgi:hypothetical protein